MRSERRKKLLPSRREPRNRQFLFAQIKNSPATESPLRIGWFLERREKRRAAQEFVSRPRTLGLFPLVRFTPTKRVPPDKLENQRTPENHPDRQAKKISSTDTLLWTPSGLGTMPRTACRQRRTANYVLACSYPTFRNVPPAHANIQRLRSRNPKNAKSVLLDENCEPFPRDWSTIGAAKRAA